MEMKSRWLSDAAYPTHGALDHDVRVDVAVVGGGIMGVAAAYILKNAGLAVALLERDRLGHAETGHTTAHLTYVTDTRLSQLVAHFGRGHAQAVWDAGNAALEFIHQTVEREKLACEFLHVPGCLHLPRGVHADRHFLKECSTRIVAAGIFQSCHSAHYRTCRANAIGHCSISAVASMSP